MPHLTSGDQLDLPPCGPTPAVPTTTGSLSPRVPNGRQTYFHQRLAAIGVPLDQAETYGLSADEEGNILQRVRTFDGGNVEYIPHRDQRRWEMLQRRKTPYNLHEDQFFQPLQVTRRHPDILATNPQWHKYDNPYKQKLRPLPAPRAIEAYRNGTTGGLIVFTEGYFKAAALDVGGIEAIAFLGITVYRLNPDLRNYLSQRLPDQVFITYDADALQPAGSVRAGLAPALNSRRNRDFANSAQRFATQLFDLFTAINHDCQICFVMGKPAPTIASEHPPAAARAQRADNSGSSTSAASTYYKGEARLPPGEAAKGIDDLISVHGHALVITDLKNLNPSPTLTESRFFAGFTLARSSYRRKLKTFFLKKHYREWAKHHSRGNFNQLAEGFRYQGAHYRARSTGDLLDETITYELLNDPFQTEVPTEHLQVTRFLDEQKATVSRFIETHPISAIEAPTGSGKTTFLIKYARRTKQPLVIAVPTINLAQQIARQHKGYALTGNYHPAKVQAANDADLIACTYDTLQHVPHLFLRLLVFDEAHNFVNQYGQVFRGYQPFRAETLRRCATLLPEAKRTILLSGTMPPMLCHTLGAHLLTVNRTTNPNVRIFDLEANGSKPDALARTLLSNLIEVLPPLAQRAETCGSLKAQRLNAKRSEATSNSGEAASKRHEVQSKSSAPKQIAKGKLHVVFWNNTEQLSLLKNLIAQLGCLRPDQIATITRSHYNRGEADTLDDIISRQRIKPSIRLLLCTCLISEGVNIKNRNVGRIFTVGLTCTSTFRQFIARFRKLKVVNVFSILPAERDLQPEFFLPAEEELHVNLERAKLQAYQLEKARERHHQEFSLEELPFIQDIDRQIEARYSPFGGWQAERHSEIFPLTYHDGSWKPDPLHVLAAIRGRQLATANNCYFYTRLRAIGFTVLRVKKQQPNDDVDDAVSTADQTRLEDQKAFQATLLNDLLTDPEPVINALYLWYTERGNRHGSILLHQLVPDLLDDVKGATGTSYLSRNQHHFNDQARNRILCFARLHAFGVQDKSPFLELSPTEFNRHYRAAKFHFEQLLYNDSTARKLMLPDHKEEIRIKQKIAQHCCQSRGKPSDKSKPAPEDEPPSASGNQEALSGEALLQLLRPLLSVPRSAQPGYAFRKERGSPNASRTEDFTSLDLLGLSPARAINLLRQTTHCTVTGSGRYRTITVHDVFTSDNPPSLAAVATNLITDPGKIIPLLAA